MHIKTVLSDSYDFGEPTVQLVKVSERGLIGEDFKGFVKRAGFRMADVVRKFEDELKPGDTLIHGLALGATEFYGPNRNGDGFKKKACQQYHPTFVKYARWYRNHKNKDPSKSYGLIKHSEFNDAMKRIELLAILNRTKEAADRNGGLIADEEHQMLEAGKDIPTSMACKVAYDVCAGCQNKARTRAEYCLGVDEGGMCKRGGVKNRMGFVHDDGFMNHVDNPHPAFFDWSKVYRGADRTSFADGILKAASPGLVIGGAELAEKMGVELPPIIFDVQPIWPTRLENLAAKLASYETQCEEGNCERKWDKALAPQFAADWNMEKAGDNPFKALVALAANKIVLPPAQWLELVHGPTKVGEWCSAEMIQQGLPGIYGRMLADGSIKEASSQLPYLGGHVPYEQAKWAMEMAPYFSLQKEIVEHRIKRAALRGYPQPDVCQPPLVKSAGAAETMARGYALYKLAFLQALVDRDPDFDLTSTMAIRQNYLNAR